MITCNAKIEHPESKGIKVTYCALETGHKGQCADNFTPKIIYNRCSNLNKDNVRCGLPANHIGRHSNQSLGYGVNSWE